MLGGPQVPSKEEIAGWLLKPISEREIMPFLMVCKRDLWEPDGCGEEFGEEAEEDEE